MIICEMPRLLKSFRRTGVSERAAAPLSIPSMRKEVAVKWVEPAFCDIRLGFEVTAYVYVR